MSLEIKKDFNNENNIGIEVEGKLMFIQQDAKEVLMLLLRQKRKTSK